MNNGKLTVLPGLYSKIIQFKITPDVFIFCKLYFYYYKIW